MPQLPVWSPPDALVRQLCAAAKELEAVVPPLQRLDATGSVNDLESSERWFSAIAEWSPIIALFSRVCEHGTRAKLAMRLSPGVLGALANTVRWRSSYDPLRCAVLELIGTMCSDDPDICSDFACLGLHTTLGRSLRSLGTSFDESDVQMQKHDELVAATIESIVGSGCPFNASPSDEPIRPAPLVFSLHGSRAEEPPKDVLLRQVPEMIHKHFDVGFKLWPNAILLSRWLMAADVGEGASARKLFSGNRVLELGSGVGLLGLAIAVGAQHSSAPSQAPVEIVLTDFNEHVLRNLRYNTRINLDPELQNATVGLPTADHTHKNNQFVRVEKLDFSTISCDVSDVGSRGSGWQTPDGALQSAADVVLGADICCSADDAKALAAALPALVAYPDGVAFLSLPHPVSRFGPDDLAQLVLSSTSPWQVEITPYSLIQVRVVNMIIKPKHLSLNVHLVSRRVQTGFIEDFL